MDATMHVTMNDTTLKEIVKGENNTTSCPFFPLWNQVQAEQQYYYESALRASSGSVGRVESNCASDPVEYARPDPNPDAAGAISLNGDQNDLKKSSYM